MKNKKIISVLLFIAFFTSFLLYKNSLQSYFFQDDWFTIKISQADSFPDLLRFFLPRDDVIYYRPLGMQLPFFLSHKLFGLSPLPLHIFLFVIHGFNIYLIFKLTQRLSQRNDVSLLTTFFYGTSSIHFIPYFWSSTVSFPLGLMFIIITFILYLDWQTKRKFYLLYVLLAEFIALLTNELALTIPLLILIYMKIFSKVSYKIFVIMMILPILYVAIRVTNLPKLEETYTIILGKSTLYAALTYLLWLFNWPEEIKHQLENFRVGNISYFSSFPFQNMILVSVTLALLFLLIRFFSIILNQKIKDRKLPVFSLGIILLGLVFPLLFPLHIYPYYLLLTLIGFSLFLSLAIIHLLRHSSLPHKRFYLPLILFSWVISSSITINFQTTNHWAYQRSKISQLLIEDILKRFPSINDGQKVYIENASYKIMLSDQNAFKVIYNKDIPTIFYGKESNIWDYNIDKDISLQNERFKWNYVK